MITDLASALAVNDMLALADISGGFSIRTSMSNGVSISISMHITVNASLAIMFAVAWHVERVGAGTLQGKGVGFANLHRQLWGRRGALGTRPAGNILHEKPNLTRRS